MNLKNARGPLLRSVAVEMAILSLLLSAITGCGQDKTDVKIMAAASLSDAFLEIAEAFEAQTGLKTSLYSAGSATLATQIIEGANADVIALANEQTMDRIVVSDQVAPEYRIQIFASNHLVLVTPLGNPASILSFADTLGKKIAVCAPAVPCGSLSYAFAEQEGIKLNPASVEPSVRSVRTKVELGEVDAGLIYKTDVTAGLEVIEIPELESLTTMYPIAVIKGADLTAVGFIDFVLSETGQEILGRYGFERPYEN